MRGYRHILFLLCFAFFCGPVWAEKRVALVIGNSAYRTMPPLKNPNGDSHDIAAALKDLGFEVTLKNDLGRNEMLNVMEEFADISIDADISIFYYAGHGIQVELHNYLIPTDTVLEHPQDVIARTIDLQGIIDRMKVGEGVRIFFLDACRNNPLSNMKVPDGLAQPDLPRENFLISYAASRGQVAYDGGGRNSPFAAALIQNIQQKGQDVAAVLAAARRNVILVTGAKQLPQEWSTLSRKVSLAPGEPEKFPPETLLFQLAAGGSDPDLLKLYLNRYPEGAHAADARSLTETVAAGKSHELSRDTRQVEELLWALARNERIDSLLELYLARYPEGDHAAEARTLLDQTTDENISSDALCLRLANHPNDSTENATGVPAAVLHEHREQAIVACRRAVVQFPDNPHYLALLARALAAGVAASEIPAEAIKLYEQAAERGDARAMVSLGLLKQTGNGVPKDPEGAVDLYEQAANLHFPDGGVQLGYALATGVGIGKNMERAVAVYKQASLDGSATATYDLGVLYLDKRLGFGSDVEALDLFLRAAEQGEVSGYTAAAKMVDGGYNVERDHEAAAQYLLMGISTDSGEALAELTEKAQTWSTDTIRAVQRRLYDAGYYEGGIDGESGPKIAAALNQWRLLGPAPGF